MPKLAELKNHLPTIRRKMATENDPIFEEALREEYRNLVAEIEEEQAVLDKLPGLSKPNTMTPEQQAEAAMNLFDDMDRIVHSETARAEFGVLLDRLGCRIGLCFGDAIKGKTRKVRRLIGGQVVFGDRLQPNYGPPQEIPFLGGELNDVSTDSGGTHPNSDECSVDDNRTPFIITIPSPSQGAGCEPTTKNTPKKGASADALPPAEAECSCPKGHQDDISSTKVSRGDWI